MKYYNESILSALTSISGRPIRVDVNIIEAYQEMSLLETVRKLIKNNLW